MVPTTLVSARCSVRKTNQTSVAVSPDSHQKVHMTRPWVRCSPAFSLQGMGNVPWPRSAEEPAQPPQREGRAADLLTGTEVTTLLALTAPGGADWSPQNVSVPFLGSHNKPMMNSRQPKPQAGRLAVKVSLDSDVSTPLCAILFPTHLKG